MLVISAFLFSFSFFKLFVNFFDFVLPVLSPRRRLSAAEPEPLICPSYAGTCAERKYKPDYDEKMADRRQQGCKMRFSLIRGT